MSNWNTHWLFAMECDTSLYIRLLLQEDKTLYSKAEGKWRGGQRLPTLHKQKLMSHCESTLKQQPLSFVSVPRSTGHSFGYSREKNLFHFECTVPRTAHGSEHLRINLPLRICWNQHVICHDKSVTFKILIKRINHNAPTCQTLYYHSYPPSCVTNHKANKANESISNSIPLLNETNLISISQHTTAV